jgi:hypothetical protein
MHLSSGIIELTLHSRTKSMFSRYKIQWLSCAETGVEGRKKLACFCRPVLLEGQYPDVEEVLTSVCFYRIQLQIFSLTINQSNNYETNPLCTCSSHDDTALLLIAAAHAQHMSPF